MIRNTKLKILYLTTFSCLLFIITNWYFLILSFLFTLSLYFVKGFSIIFVLKELKKIIYFLVIIFLAHCFFDSWTQGLYSIIRLIILFLFSSLVTITTKTSEMIEAIESFCEPLCKFGLNNKKVALAISLGIRFIPLIKKVYREVLMAQKARGIENNLISLLVPTIIRTLKMADDISDAIEARS
ncbi:MAG: energy-coupling factor transporter transmembrane protein EcfT [Bacteroidetes bacterium]|nr:energy-coupling factor transporter transmembrane protein EcfT [Bacteroidota bacterium]